MTKILHSPIYDLKDKEVCIFGDIEGGWPFAELIKSQHKDLIPFELIKEENQTTRSSHININLQEKQAVVFTGDLIDNYGPYDIQWLEAMVNAKSKYPDQVLLGIGNRDINKIRLIDECFIVKTDNNEEYFPWEKENISFQKLCSNISESFKKKDNVYKFAFSQKDIITKFNKINKPSQPTKSLWKYDDGSDAYPGYDKDPSKNIIVWSDDLSRIKNIYITLGTSSAIDNRWLELYNMGLVDTKNVEIEIKYVAVALTNMMMGLQWSEKFMTNSGDNIKNIFKKLNGLYIKYLNSAHIIGKFICIQNTEEKNCLFSHSGIPPYLSYPIGYAPRSNFDNYKTDDKTDDKTDLDNILIYIDHEKKDFLHKFIFNDFIECRKLKEYITQQYNNIVLYRFIQLSANTGVKIYPNYVVGSDFSPIVTHATNNLSEHNIFKHNIKNYDFYEDYNTFFNNNYKGGYDEEEVQKTYYEFKTNDVQYNIFGHQPQGLFPIALKQDETVHVCLDVSSVSKYQSGIGTCAFMHLKNREIKIKGIIKFPDDNKYKYNPEKVSQLLEYDFKIEDFQYKIKDYMKLYDRYARSSIRHLNVNKFIIDNDEYEIEYVLYNNFDNTVKFTKIAASEKKGGKLRTKNLKKTTEKIKIDEKMLRNIYIGPRGGEYVKIKGEFVSVKSLGKAQK